MSHSASKEAPSVIGNAMNVDIHVIPTQDTAPNPNGNQSAAEVKVKTEPVACKQEDTAEIKKPEAKKPVHFYISPKEEPADENRYVDPSVTLFLRCHD